MSWECSCKSVYNENHCQFSIWAPGPTGQQFGRDLAGNRAFSCFAMESEGDLPTRRGKIEKVIKSLAQSYNPNDFAVQCAAYDFAGLDSDTLTAEEVEYIENEVARKWPITST